MFKLVVVCAFLAAAMADPAVVTSYPFAYSGAPLAASYVSPVGGVYPPYGLSHLIKKRSAPLAYTASYIAPGAYLPAAPLAYTTAAHLIKKRSAPLAAAYVAPNAYAAPLLASAYSGVPVYSSHFINKRSAPLAVNAYLSSPAYLAQAPSYVASAPIEYAF